MPRITQELVERYVADNNGLTTRQIAEYFNTTATHIKRKYNDITHFDVFPTTWKGIYAIENIVQVGIKHYIKKPIPQLPVIETRLSSTSEASSEATHDRKEESDLHMSGFEEPESIDLPTLTPADHMQKIKVHINEQIAGYELLSSALSQSKERLIKSVAKNTESLIDDLNKQLAGYELLSSALRQENERLVKIVAKNTEHENAQVAKKCSL